MEIWQKDINLDEREWDLACKSYPIETQLLNRLMPNLVTHLKQKSEPVKGIQMARLKSKIPRTNLAENIRGIFPEIFWFTRLISNGWNLTIEPDYPDPGPDCLGRINNESIYFEISSLPGFKMINRVNRYFSLAKELKKRRWALNYLIDIIFLDPNFDRKHRNDIINAIKSKIKQLKGNKGYLYFNSPTQDFDIIEDEMTSDKFYDYPCLFGFYARKPNMPLAGCMFSYSPEPLVIKQIFSQIEDKLKKDQFKRNRENYFVIFIPSSSYSSSPVSNFESIAGNVSRYRNRLDYIHGLIILRWKVENSIYICKYEVKPNPKIIHLISDSLRRLCEEDIKMKIE
jgi:hypothetical protein